MLFAALAGAMLANSWPWLSIYLAGFVCLVDMLTHPKAPLQSMPDLMLALGLPRAAGVFMGWSDSPALFAGLAAPMFAMYMRPPALGRQLRRLGLVLAGVALANLVAGDPSYLLHRNILAGCLVPCLAAWLPQLQMGRKNAGYGLSRPTDDHPTCRPRRTYSGPICFGLVALALCSTVSRAGILAGLLLIAWHYRLFWRGVLAAGLLAPGLVMLRNSSVINWRLTCWAKALDLWQTSPWWGVGVGVPVWPASASGGHAHNLWLGALAWTGVIGLAALLVGQGLTWRNLSRHKAWHTWQAAGLVGMMVHSITEDFTGCLLWLLLLGALLVSAGTTTPGGISGQLANTTRAGGDRLPPETAIGSGNPACPTTRADGGGSTTRNGDRI